MTVYLPTLSVIVPAFNEEVRLPPTLRRIREFCDGMERAYEVLVIDDGSRDGTRWAAEGAASVWPQLQVISLPENQGKGAAVQAGMLAARGRRRLFTDADLSTPIEEFAKLEAELEGGAGVAIGSRSVFDSKVELHQPHYRELMGRAYNSLLQHLLLPGLRDTQCGFKLFSEEAAEICFRELECQHFGFDAEVLLRAQLSGIRVSEVGVVWRNVAGTRVNGLADSGRMLLDLWHLRYRFRSTPQAGLWPTGNLRHRNGRTFSSAALDTAWGRSAAPNQLQTPATLQQKAPDAITVDNLPLIGAVEAAGRRPAPSRPGASPYPVLTYSQLVTATGLIALMAGLALWAPLTTAIVINGILVILFTSANLLKLVMLRQGLQTPAVVTISAQELSHLPVASLPIYTALIPLYHEAAMVPGLIAAVAKLDYPKNKLDIKFLLEGDDLQTRQAVEATQLPSWVEMLNVPDRGPRGKPRACNLGLARARGQYLVIYDAEDRPEPQQLLKAVAAFRKLSPQTICLQAKLNYYNRTQNLLTRWGTAEYSSWFDLLLPGMQSLDVAMPLGGTSNHFATENLRQLGGWEAYNVTEDADLGVRLFNAGYKTAMIESTTYEEANSRYGNWLRQRSRWIKGYMQTYLAHMRHPLQLYRQMGFRAYLVFQLFFGISTLCLLFNPIYWGLAIMWWCFHAHGIESIFPSVILYAGTACLLLGNIAFLLTAMSGCLVRRNYGDLKWVLLSPIYWLLMSLAAWKALGQLILRPHYWEKTTHGHYVAANGAALYNDPHPLASAPPPSTSRPRS